MFDHFILFACCGELWDCLLFNHLTPKCKCLKLNWEDENSKPDWWIFNGDAVISQSGFVLIPKVTLLKNANGFELCVCNTGALTCLMQNAALNALKKSGELILFFYITFLILCMMWCFTTTSFSDDLWPTVRKLWIFINCSMLEFHGWFV